MLTKPQAIALWAAGPSPYRRIEAVDMQVRVFGATALAHGVDRWERDEAGRLRSGRFVWSDTWLRRGGRWQIVQDQDVELPPR